MSQDNPSALFQLYLQIHNYQSIFNIWSLFATVVLLLLLLQILKASGNSIFRKLKP